MRNNLQIYHRLLQQLCQWLPGERSTRLRNLALLVIGLYREGSVHLSHVVASWPLPGKAPSLVNRLHRFLSNWRVSPLAYYQPLAALLLHAVAGKPVCLLVDTTKVGFNHRALVIALAFRRRSLPLAWSVHQGRIGNVAVPEIVRLLDWVYQLVPSDCQVSLCGDTAFCASDLLFWLRQHDWHYVIRHRQETWVRHPAGDWFPLTTVPIVPGESVVVGWVWLAKSNPFGPTWLLLHWQPGEQSPWILVSDCDDRRWVLRTYQRRMWIEEMYGDMKGHGFDLEATQLRHTDRLERLLLGVCLAYVWLLALGSWVVKNGQRHLLDRKDRRDKSYFRLGRDWLKRASHFAHPPPFRFVPYF